MAGSGSGCSRGLRAAETDFFEEFGGEGFAGDGRGDLYEVDIGTVMGFDLDQVGIGRARKALRGT